MIPPTAVECTEDAGGIGTDVVYSMVGDKRVTQTTQAKKPCPPPIFPPKGMTQQDWERFKKGLCWAESDPDCPCCDNKVGTANDVGRYQFTPLAVYDIYKYYCEDCKTDRCKQGCAELKAICPDVKKDSSCASKQDVADKLLELWSGGRWYPDIERKQGESDWQYYHRILGIFHCGKPSKLSCAEYGPLPPLTTPGQNYFIKFWCEYKRNGGTGPDPTGWNQDWCKPKGNK
jgi:hypothetical protein